LANPAIEAAQKLVTRRNFSRTGFPSAAVSTAATNGVFDGMGCMPMSVGDEEHHCAEW
jgi:hypothetical protein